jgi:hypothetical protein
MTIPLQSPEFATSGMHRFLLVIRENELQPSA